MDVMLGVGIAERFKDALRRIEESGNVEDIVGLFAPDAALLTPAKLHPMQGREQIRRFWEDYREAFTAAETEFIRTIESEGNVCLEWISRVTPRFGGGPVEYAGVTLLSLDGDQVREMRSYFDPRLLMP